MIVEGEGYLDGVRYAMRCRFEYAVSIADAAGLNIRVTSGFRTRAEQEQLYERWIACKAAIGTKRYAHLCEGVYPANPPGESLHEIGLAVDSVPVVTSQFAAAYNRGMDLTSPTLPTSGVSGEVYAGIYPSDDPRTVSQLGAMLWWKTVRERASLWVPSNDMPHSEPCEARDLRARGLLP